VSRRLDIITSARYNYWTPVFFVLRRKGTHRISHCVDCMTHGMIRHGGFEKASDLFLHPRAEGYTKNRRRLASVGISSNRSRDEKWSFATQRLVPPIFASVDTEGVSVRSIYGGEKSLH